MALRPPMYIPGYWPTVMLKIRKRAKRDDLAEFIGRLPKAIQKDGRSAGIFITDQREIAKFEQERARLISAIMADELGRREDVFNFMSRTEKKNPDDRNPGWTDHTLPQLPSTRRIQVSIFSRNCPNTPLKSVEQEKCLASFTLAYSKILRAPPLHGFIERG